MKEQRHTAPIHLSVQRLEFAFGRGALEHRAVHRHAQHAQIVEGATHLAQGCIHVRQRQRRECREPLRVATGQLGIRVVAGARHFNGILLRLGVRRHDAVRKHLQFDTGCIHVVQAPRHVRF